MQRPKTPRELCNVLLMIPLSKLLNFNCARNRPYGVSLYRIQAKVLIMGIFLIADHYLFDLQAIIGNIRSVAPLSPHLETTMGLCG